MKLEDAEIARLKRELLKTKAERDILKNHGVLKVAAIAEYRHLWPLAWICEIVEVTRAGLYAWLERPKSAGVARYRPDRSHPRVLSRQHPDLRSEASGLCKP